MSVGILKRQPVQAPGSLWSSSGYSNVFGSGRRMLQRRRSSATSSPMTKSIHPNAAAFPPGVSGPALRALHGAGIGSLADLAKWSEQELAKLHGMGPKALGVLKAALKAQGHSLRAG